MLVVDDPRRVTLYLKPLPESTRPAYRQNMGKGDDDAPPICGTCLGAGGEWVELNGKKGQERKWVKCKACNGTGRR